MNITVNISFQDTLLEDIDAEAKRESRSRSELLREAARMYIQRQNKWSNIFELGDQITDNHNLKQADVNRAIKTVRKNS